MNNLYSKLITHRPVRNLWMIGCTRTLFSKHFLGIKDYEMRRSVQLPFDPKKVELKSETGKLAAFIKYWFHVLNKEECVEKFSKVQTSLRLIYDDPAERKAFKYGTLVMRMLHYLDLPDQALKIFNDEHIPMMFNEIQSKLVLLDLLFNHKMYEDMLHIIKMDNEEQEKKHKGLSAQLNCLAFAACYKLNTEAHLKYGLDLWKKLPKEIQLHQSANFLSMLAINLGHPKTALDILESSKKLQGNTIITVFIRLIALADCGYFAEAIQCIQQNKKDFPEANIYTNVVERINQSLNKYPTTEDKENFIKLLDTIPHHKWKQTFDEMICFTIDPSKGSLNRAHSPNYRNFSKVNVNRPKTSQKSSKQNENQESTIE
ncbi:pentatricopeptide repeat-containing protein 2, mitochondrial-like [Contarinia nasturtii]|uniref:pentatricopeptide repeat-containing protein 2, mitochondrial-like n=1 Tax=Contarinia nasturtii TaxID=265458 RepID=UPI0012D3AF01|nr:pentatricopeptide repeat-containing protein 2, mitochondrial-like [Contarinia nasturtii]